MCEYSGGGGGRVYVCVYLHFQHFLKVGSVCVALHELGVACNELLSLFMWGHYNLHRTTANTIMTAAHKHVVTDTQG